MNIIHKYKIIKKINSGGQGTFYLVKYKVGEATNDRYQNFKDLSVFYFLEPFLIHAVLEVHLECLEFIDFKN